MPERTDPKNLHTAGDGTIRDFEGSIHTKEGFLKEKSPQRIAREARSQSVQTQKTINHAAQERKMIKDAVKKAGGLFYLPKFNFSLGFVGWFFIGFFALGLLSGLSLFLESPDGERMIGNVGSFFSSVGFHIAAFLFAWPQTFSELFDHWFYLPELLVGVFLLYYLIKTASDNGFYREDGIKCLAPYLLIEGIRALFLRDPEFTKLACVLRGLGLGIGLCILVWIARKILIRN